MERIILRHLTGSKSNQIDELPIADHPEVTLGRDPAATVSYDAQLDDLVSRQQARIARDPADSSRFVLHDMGSRNGTFVNKQRVTGQSVLQPGDVVQFGAGGPEFQFDLDPRPNAAGATREADIAAMTAPATRESSTLSTPPTSPSPALSTPVTAASGTGEPPKVGVGKATLEREITRAKSDTRTIMMWSGAGLAFAAALLVGFLMWSNRSSEDALAGKLAATENKLTETRQAIDDEEANRDMTPAEIAQKVVPSVVFIKMSWKLIDTDSGGIVYHQYLPGNNGQRVPGYVLNQDGS